MIETRQVIHHLFSFSARRSSDNLTEDYLNVLLKLIEIVLRSDSRPDVYQLIEECRKAESPAQFIEKLGVEIFEINHPAYWCWDWKMVAAFVVSISEMVELEPQWFDALEEATIQFLQDRLGIFDWTSFTSPNFNHRDNIGYVITPQIKTCVTAFESACFGICLVSMMSVLVGLKYLFFK